MDQEQRQERLEQLQDSIGKELFDEWQRHPVTEFIQLQFEERVDNLKLFLENGSYIDHENGLIRAAEAKGAKDAYEDMLEIEFGEAEEEEDERQASGI